MQSRFLMIIVCSSFAALSGCGDGQPQPKVTPEAKTKIDAQHASINAAQKPSPDAPKTP
jgi:hypothetical protein